MFGHVPNALTTHRLVLAARFFPMLSWYQYEGRGDPMLLNVALLVYVPAHVTADRSDGGTGPPPTWSCSASRS
jgi:hypothetical protein